MRTTIPERRNRLAEVNFFAAGEELVKSGPIYERELEVYSCVAKGDCENIQRLLGGLFAAKLRSGGLDVKKTDEIRYRAAEIINIAARYAAQSGPDEGVCLGVADECVSRIDKAASEEEVVEFLGENILTLTRLVRTAKQNSVYPYLIRRAINYINGNIGKNITVTDVANACRVSPDYLSTYFKKTVGVRMTAYIRRCKLLLAKDMLGCKMKCADTAMRLSFCSESYFVKCFKDEFGVTPKKWQSSL